MLLGARLRGHFRAAGVPIKRRCQEFKVTPDALLPVGTAITAAHFTPGQYVDVQGAFLLMFWGREVLVQACVLAWPSTRDVLRVLRLRYWWRSQFWGQHADDYELEIT